MKLIIAGSREFEDYEKMFQVVSDFLASVPAAGENIEIVSGCCRGADILGERVAKELGFPVRRFPAEWKKYGKAAGSIRNAQMASYADACLLFPVPKAENKGTKNMAHIAKEKGLKIYYATP